MQLGAGELTRQALEGCLAPAPRNPRARPLPVICTVVRWDVEIDDDDSGRGAYGTAAPDAPATRADFERALRSLNISDLELRDALLNSARASSR